MNFQRLKDFLDYYLPMLGVPGSDTVIYKNHEQVFRYQSGYDSLRLRTPVRQDAIYNIYSCSQAVICTALMQLVERGEILITDPLYAFIPEFRDARVGIKDENGNVISVKKAENPITVKHLLTMTSGINNNINSPFIKSAITASFGSAPTLDICRVIASEPLDFEPGERYQYGLSHDILGGVIEVVSGQRLGDYVKQNIFDPLGMRDTAYHLDSSKFFRIAAQYVYDTKTREAVEITAHCCDYRLGSEYDGGGAGLFSTVDDYILLADALANRGVCKNGNRILSEYSIDLMTTNMLSDAQIKDFSLRHNLGYGFGYGMRVNMNPAEVGNLAPKGEFGCDGEKLCYFSADPENKIAVFHAEHMGGLHHILIPRLRNLVYSCLGEKY